MTSKSSQTKVQDVFGALQLQHGLDTGLIKGDLDTCPDQSWIYELDLEDYKRSHSQATKEHDKR